MRRFYLVAYQNNYGDEWVWVDRRKNNGKWERIALDLNTREYYINEVKVGFIVYFPRYIWKEILQRHKQGY